MTDSYANHPRSITELKSDKTDRASDWTPRDALISLLREIDSGALDLDALVIVLRKRSESPPLVQSTSFRVASPDVHTTLGMLTEAVSKIMQPDD